MLEEYSPLEAQKASQLRFLDWLLLIQQVSAIVLIVAKFLNPGYVNNIEYGLELFSQNAQGILPLAILLGLHVGIFLTVFLVKKSFAHTIILSWLALMILYSLVELFVGNISLFNIAGLLISILWGLYFITSKRVKVRYFYTDYFDKARHTIICPRCKKEVILGSERCGDTLTNEERFTALQTRITDAINVPSWVRISQIEIIEQTYGQKAVPFLKELYQKELKSVAPNVQMASTLLKTFSKYPEPALIEPSTVPSKLPSKTRSKKAPSPSTKKTTSTKKASAKPSRKTSTATVKNKPKTATGKRSSS